MGLKALSPSRWGCDSVSYLSMSKLGCGAGKHLVWGSQSGRPVSPPCSLVRVYPQLASADEQSHWLRLLFRHCPYELGLPRSVCWLLQTPLSFSVIVIFSIYWNWNILKYIWHIEIAIPVVCNESMGAHWMTHNAGGSRTSCSLLGSLFHWRNWRLRRHLSPWCCTVLGNRHYSQDTVTSLIQSILISELHGVVVRGGWFFSLSGISFLDSCWLFFLWDGANSGMMCITIWVISVSPNILSM